MIKKYQPTELDRVLQQSKQMFPEWTIEDKLEYQLLIQKKFHQKSLERMAVKNAELYTDNVLLKRQIKDLESQLEKYHKLQSKDNQYWCKGTDENGNKIPMTKVKGSRVMSKEEVEELNKIKLPF
jgi:hypothetical protein